MNRDHLDALLDQLLREILGGDRPRDMTARILARATIGDRSRRRWWIGAGAAIAACVAIATSLYFLWPRQYPAPEFTGVIAVDSGQPLAHGVPLETTTQPGEIELGGYVDVHLKPDTKFQLGGEQLAEEIFLDTGHVDVDVTKKKGRFDVGVGPVDIEVTGTEFSVDVTPETVAGTASRHVVVAVTEGTVRVKDGEKTSSVQKGESLVLDPPLAAPPQITATAPAATKPSETVPATNAGGNAIPVAPATATAPVTLATPQPPDQEPPPAPATLPATTPAPLAVKGGRINMAAVPTAPAGLRENTLSNDASIETEGMLMQRNGKLFIQNSLGLTPLPAENSLPPNLPPLDGLLDVKWVNGKVASIRPVVAPPSPNPAPR